MGAEWETTGAELETVGAELETVAPELETVCEIGNSMVRNWKQHGMELETVGAELETAQHRIGNKQWVHKLELSALFFCKLSTLWSSSLKMQSSCVGSAGNPHCSCKKCGV